MRRAGREAPPLKLVAGERALNGKPLGNAASVSLCLTERSVRRMSLPTRFAKEASPRNCDYLTRTASRPPTRPALQRRAHRDCRRRPARRRAPAICRLEEGQDQPMREAIFFFFFYFFFFFVGEPSTVGGRSSRINGAGSAAFEVEKTRPPMHAPDWAVIIDWIFGRSRSTIADPVSSRSGDHPAAAGGQESAWSAGFIWMRVSTGEAAGGRLPPRGNSRTRPGSLIWPVGEACGSDEASRGGALFCAGVDFARRAAQPCRAPRQTRTRLSTIRFAFRSGVPHSKVIGAGRWLDGLARLKPGGPGGLPSSSWFWATEMRVRQA